MAPRPEYWHRYVIELSRYRQVDTLEILAGYSQVAKSARDSSAGNVARWEERYLQHTFVHDNLARDVIVRSSGDGTRIPRISDIERLCDRYVNLADPVLWDKSGDRLDRYLVRIAYEQFRYQLSPYGELCRSWALFGETGAQLGANSMEPSAWRKALGCDLLSFLQVIFCIEIIASKTGGIISTSSLDWDTIRRVAPGLSESESPDVLKKLTATIGALRSQSIRPVKGYEKYAFNPLTGAPLIVSNHRIIAPSAFLLMQRGWPNNLYYDRVGEEDFRNQIGDVFEAYVGRQLKQLEVAGIAEVHPAIKYVESGAEKASTDWIVVFPSVVLLVEAKAGRLTAPSRLGLDELDRDVERTLGVAYEQLERTARLISESSPHFAHIPNGREFLGFAVTLDPFWLFRDPTQVTPRPFSMEIHPVGIHEIEVLVQAALAGPIESALMDMCIHEDNQSRRVRRILADLELTGNPILDSVFDEMLPGHWE